jgi:xanthine dehydrogenase accessory factor
LKAQTEIGDQIKKGQTLALVRDRSVIAPFDGVLRGLLHHGLSVQRGQKIGDLDPRNDPKLAEWVSEKSLAIGGGVLEALLTDPEIRARLWN